MIISKENRRTIYESLFKEGVMVAPKDFEVKHPELDIPNLQVVKACQSLTSKGFVHTQFSWQWYFYTLTNEVSWSTAQKRLFAHACPVHSLPRASNTSGNTFTCPPRSCPPRTSDRPAPLALLAWLVVAREALTALPEVTETVVTMPTARRTRPPLESSDLASVVLDEVLPAPSREKRTPLFAILKRWTLDCTSDNLDVGLVALSN